MMIKKGEDYASLGYKESRTGDSDVSPIDVYSY